MSLLPRCFGQFSWMEVSSVGAMTLFHLSWLMLLVGLVVWFVLRLIPHRRPQVRYVTLCLAFFALPGIAICLGLSQLKQGSESDRSPHASALPKPTEKKRQVESGQSSGSDQVESRRLMSEPQGSSSLNAKSNSPRQLNGPPTRTPTSSAYDSVSTQSTFAEISTANISARANSDSHSPLAMPLFAAYVLGVIAMSIRLFLMTLSAHRVGRNANDSNDRELHSLLAQLSQRLKLRSTPILKLCDEVLIPTVCGIFKPVILLPPSIICSLSQKDLEAVLLHELAHVRRWDLLVNMLQRAIEILFFFHPVTWWLSHQISVERENCCDDMAAGHGPGSLQYANALVNVAEICLDRRNTKMVGVAIDGNHAGQLRLRIERQLGLKTAGRLGVIQTTLLLTLLSAALSLFGFSYWEMTPVRPQNLGERDNGYSLGTSIPTSKGTPHTQDNKPLADLILKQEDPAAGPQANDSSTNEKTASDKGKPQPKSDSLPRIFWGKEQDGIRLGFSIPHEEDSEIVIHHEELLEYNVFVQNNRKEVIHVVHDPNIYTGVRFYKGELNLIGLKNFLSFLLPKEAFLNAIDSIKPGQVQQLKMGLSNSVVIDRPDATEKPGRYHPVKLPAGEYPLQAAGQFTILFGGEKSLERRDSRWIELKSAKATLKVLPQPRLQIRRLQLVSKTNKLDSPANNPAVKAYPFKDSMGYELQFITNKNYGILAHSSDFFGVEYCSAKQSILSLSSKAIARIQKADKAMQAGHQSRYLGIFLDGKLISAAQLRKPIESSPTHLPVDFSPENRKLFEEYIQQHHYRYPCQTAWSPKIDGLQLGAKLLGAENGQLKVLHFIRKIRDLDATVLKLSPEKGILNLKPYEVLPLGSAVVINAKDSPRPGRYRVSPSLKKNGGRYEASSEILIQRGDSFEFVKNQAGTHSLLLLEYGPLNSVPSPQRKQPDSEQPSGSPEQSKKPTRLDLSGSQVTTENLRSLFVGNPYESVSLRNAKFTGEIINIVAEAKSIQHLKLSGIGLSGHIPRLAKIPGLTRLELHTPLLVGDLKAVSKLQSLRELTLPKDLALTVTGARQIAKLGNLLKLNLSGVDVDDASFKELGSLTRLVQLDLSHTRVTDQGLTSLQNFPSLQTLELTRHPFGEEQISDQCIDSLKKLHKLSLVSLSGSITDRGLKEIARLPNLKSISILNTKVTPQGLDGLRHTGIQHLTLPASLLRQNSVFLKDCPMIQSISVHGEPGGAEDEWMKKASDIDWSFSG